MSVDEVRRVLRHQVIKEVVQIRAGRGIGIFIDHQAATGVLHKHRRLTGENATGAHHTFASIRDLIRAFAPGGDGEAVSVRGHGMPMTR